MVTYSPFSKGAYLAHLKDDAPAMTIEELSLSSIEMHNLRQYPG
jgi:hypothetical protein